LEKVRATKRFFDLPSLLNQRFSVEFEIRFIDEHGSLRRSLRNPNQDIACNRGSSWIVRIRHGDQAGTSAELLEQVPFRKCEVVTGKHFDNARAFSLRKYRVHGEGGHDDERFVSGIEIGGTKQMNRFVPRRS